MLVLPCLLHRTSNIDNLTSAIDTLAIALIDNLGAVRNGLRTARNNSQKFAYYDDANTMTQSNIFLDLRDFCEEINLRITNEAVNNAANAVINAIGNPGGNLILHEDHQNGSGATPNSGFYFDAGTYGLSIFFPESALAVYKNYINASATPSNLKFCQLTHWDEFLTLYCEPISTTTIPTTTTSTVPSTTTSTLDSDNDGIPNSQTTVPTNPTAQTLAPVHQLQINPEVTAPVMLTVLMVAHQMVCVLKTKEIADNDGARRCV